MLGKPSANSNRRFSEVPSRHRESVSMPTSRRQMPSAPPRHARSGQKKRPGIAPGQMLGLPVATELDCTLFRLLLPHWHQQPTTCHSEQDTLDVVSFIGYWGKIASFRQLCRSWPGATETLRTIPRMPRPVPEDDAPADGDVQEAGGAGRGRAGACPIRFEVSVSSWKFPFFLNVPNRCAKNSGDRHAVTCAMSHCRPIGEMDARAGSPRRAARLFATWRLRRPRRTSLRRALG